MVVKDSIMYNCIYYTDSEEGARRKCKLAECTSDLSSCDEVKKRQSVEVRRFINEVSEEEENENSTQDIRCSASSTPSRPVLLEMDTNSVSKSSNSLLLSQITPESSTFQRSFTPSIQSSSMASANSVTPKQNSFQSSSRVIRQGPPLLPPGNKLFEADVEGLKEQATRFLQHHGIEYNSNEG